MKYVNILYLFIGIFEIVSIVTTIKLLFVMPNYISSVLILIFFVVQFVLLLIILYFDWDSFRNKRLYFNKFQRKSKHTRLKAINNFENKSYSEELIFDILNSTSKKSEIDRLKKIIFSNTIYLSKLSPIEFETAIMELYRNQGFDVIQTKATNDGGKDGIAFKDGKKYLIECKKYDFANKIGRPLLQKFFAAMIEESADEGFFVTTSFFTKTAYNYANSNRIKLVDYEDLTSLYRMVYSCEKIPLIANINCNECKGVIKFDLENDNLEVKKQCPSCGNYQLSYIKLDDLFEYKVDGSIKIEKERILL